MDFFLRKSSPTEAKFEKVNFEGSEGGDEDVESHVELLSTNEEGVVNVSGDDVGFLHQVGVEHRPALPRPLLQLRQLVDQEDATSLRLSTWLHNPCGVGILPGDAKNFYKEVFDSPPVLLDKNVIIYTIYAKNLYKEVFDFLPVLLDKHVVICWKNKSCWDEVQIEVTPLKDCRI